MYQSPSESNDITKKEIFTSVTRFCGKILNKYKTLKLLRIILFLVTLGFGLVWLLVHLKNSFVKTNNTKDKQTKKRWTVDVIIPSHISSLRCCLASSDPHYQHWPIQKVDSLILRIKGCMCVCL